MPSPPQPTSKKSKRKRNPDTKPHILHQSTFRRPTWSYFHLTLITPSSLATTTSQTPTSPSQSSSADIDPITISPLLTQALRDYLGTTGAAIPIDILKTCGQDVWIRVPRQDARAVRAGLSTWIGACDGEQIPGVGGEGRLRVAWRVVGEAGTVLGVCGGKTAELFG
ncbi:hypothetical protein EK21DRAFT_58655 [Setomelanomma holmii]|uniref:Ribonucleases P/MRP subunit Pop8-like domain-containing protein n=1 Tax=Setomelanomma holmii TaxID=210430 RepID=A0A9P4HH92_9PLEO|nr:hypothetical protein EK21DRAFT_58655 [Setomelanomma holmii]